MLCSFSITDRSEDKIRVIEGYLKATNQLRNYSDESQDPHYTNVSVLIGSDICLSADKQEITSMWYDYKTSISHRKFLLISRKTSAHPFTNTCFRVYVCRMRRWLRWTWQPLSLRCPALSGRTIASPWQTCTSTSGPVWRARWVPHCCWCLCDKLCPVMISKWTPTEHGLSHNLSSYVHFLFKKKIQNIIHRQNKQTNTHTRRNSIRDCFIPKYKVLSLWYVHDVTCQSESSLYSGKIGGCVCVSFFYEH